MLNKKPYAILAAILCCAALALTLSLALGGSPQRASGETPAQAMTNCDQAQTSDVMQGYGTTRAAMATAGTADQVHQWIQTRAASRGGPPDRGLDKVSGDTTITVCVVQGTFPSMAPVPPGTPSDAPPSTVDGARFLLFPDGTIVVDAIGPLSDLESLTPSTFSH